MIGLDVGDGALLTYGTLVLQRRLDGMLAHNQALAGLARTLRSRDLGVAKSNAGGWQSTGNIFALQDPTIAVLARHIQEAIQRISMVAKQMTDVPVEFEASLFGWVNINRAGDYNQPHTHPGNTWSGVYYVRTGEAGRDRPDSGVIEFVDPRPRCDFDSDTAVPHSGALRVAPTDGTLLIFPSYLEHFVHPYWGSGERITLAFNSLVRRLARRA